jgi:hypothetical protein
MGLNFKFIVIWKALSTMSSKVYISATGVKPGGFGSAGSKATSSAASVAAPKAALKAAHVAAPLECAEFKAGKPCSRGQRCRDEKCRNASKADAATSPKSTVKGGDGCVSAQLSAMQSLISSMHTKVDSLTKQVATGFTETKCLLTEQQQASIQMQKAMEAMMLASASFQSGVTGLITGSAPRRELPPPPATRLAICTGSSSSVTEVVERSGAKGGFSEPKAHDFRMTGTHMDSLRMICSNQDFPPEGYVYNVLCALFGTNTVPDHHQSLLSVISDNTKNDALAALFFLLLTGSTQFTKSSFNGFRTECESLLGSNRTSTFATFSQVCESFIKKTPKWEIKKKDVVKATNADLKYKLHHATVFDNLVKNFQN